MLSRLISAVSILMVTASCAAAPDKQTSRDDTDEPFQVPGAVVTQADIEKSLRQGQKVIVVYEKYRIANGDVKSCPVKIRTTDNVCDNREYQNSDPTVICRSAADSTTLPRDKRIIWKGEDGGKFTVTFHNNFKPCKAGEPENNPWDGSIAKNRHVCELKDGATFKVDEGQAAFIKYSVQDEDKDCEVIDPFFIVRR